MEKILKWEDDAVSYRYKYAINSENLKPVKKRKKYDYEESRTQKNCILWFNLQYQDIVIFAIPNGAKRNNFEGKNLKKEGMKKGVADLMIQKPNSQYHGLFVEMKSSEGKQSKEQKLFEQYCIKNNYQYSVCRSLDQFIEIVTNYLKC